MKGKKHAFDPIEAKYMVNWMRRCVAMDAGERGGGCRHCTEDGKQCVNGLMERAAAQLEEAIKMTGTSM